MHAAGARLRGVLPGGRRSPCIGHFARRHPPFVSLNAGSMILHYTYLIAPLALVVATPVWAEMAVGPDTITITASRSGDAVRVDQLGASVTVLEAETLRHRQTRAVSDILRDVPGVSVSRAGVLGGLTQVRMRGSEANHVLVLIDGIEASDAYQGEYDFNILMADPEARIEVLRGQQSSLYGSDAIGGVIHYISSTGAEAPGISLRAEGGSFGTYSGAARAAGVAGTLDYALSATYYHTDGTPTAHDGIRDIGSESVGTSGKLIWTPSDNVRLTGVARYSLINADLNNSELDPGSPDFGRIVDTPRVRTRNRSFHGLARVDFTALDGRWTSAISGQLSDSRRRAYDHDMLDYGSNGRRYKGSVDSSIRFGTDIVAHRLTAAMDLEREEYRNLTPFAFQGKRHATNTGLVGQYEVVVQDRLALGGSVRHDWNNRFDDSTTWRVQGSYAFPTGTRIRAAYGTGVKNPGYFDLFGYMDGRYIGNPDLRPEESRGYEIGVEQTFAEDDATIGATWFDNRLTDEIFVTYPAPDFVATPANRTTRSRQQGVEIFASARPHRQLLLEASYTYTKSEENGVAEVRRPRHMGSFNATVLSEDERFSATFTARYNGRQFDDAYIDPSYVPVRVSLEEFVLLNLGAEYRINGHFTLFGRLENLLNERYEEIFSFQASGRGGFGGVRLRF